MIKKLLKTQPMATDFAILLIRIACGGLMIYHGYSKIAAYDSILPKFDDVLGIGSALSFNLVIFAEFICAILVLAGLFTRLSIIPIFITMAVAYFIIHKSDPHSNKELALIYLILSVAVFLFGSGKLSLDKWLLKK